MKSAQLAILICIFFVGVSTAVIPTEFINNFISFSVATNETDGFKEFLRSVRVNNIPHEVLGLGDEWKGGDMKYAGGGFKINLLKKALEPLKQDKNRIIMFTDSYDVLFLSSVSEIINKFLKIDARILFAGEMALWPDKSLRDQYPEVTYGYRFLNSGGFIGYVDAIYELLNKEYVGDTDDDQLYYTKLYLNPEIRTKLNVKLDHTAEIFQNLFGATDDVSLEIDNNKFELRNIKYNTKPCVLHGNGISKLVEFRSMGNYLAQRWTIDKGCGDCNETILNLESLPVKDYPKIVIAVFISQPTPFLAEFFEDLFNQSYPKRRIHLFVHNAVPYHQKEVEEILHRHQDEYKYQFKVLPSSEQIDTITARHLAMEYCLKKSCDGYLNLDSDAHLDFPHALSSLVALNRSVVAPMLVRPFKAWSNFWGALDKAGYYKRSFDYMDIVNRKRIGLWNVPYINSCYYINGTVLKNPELIPSYRHQNLDYDMAFCHDLRQKGIYMYVDNRITFGHLIDPGGFNISRINPNVYEIFNNRFDWEKAYLHPEYEENFAANKTHVQPCPDVYWFPIVSARFCKEFIDIMEAFGQWSDGSNNDSRLKGGYEAVPTRDIHMNQVGLNQHWLEFLRLFVTPLQEMVFIGYYHNPPTSLMNFVVRYRPDEQPSLRPHHDSSTYTINIALNRPNIDYEGGGCKFLRYNCQVTDMKLGWMLMHPGRLTHFHEGLLVTKGTRYIMISFIDP